MFSHYGIAGGYNNYLGGVHVCDHITQETMKQYCIIYEEFVTTSHFKD